MEFDRLDQSFVDQQVSFAQQGVSEAAGLESQESRRLVSVAKQSSKKSPLEIEVVNQNQATLRGVRSVVTVQNFSSNTLAVLLEALPSQWKAITDRVVEAHVGGHYVIAIAGHRVQEGTNNDHSWSVPPSSVRLVGRCDVFDTMQELWCELVDDSQSGAWRSRSSTPSSVLRE